MRYDWADLIADYAHAYGGPPDPDMPWPLCLALARRAPRFDHRTRLQLLDSVSEAVAALFAKDSGLHLRMVRDELFRGSYPTDRDGPAMALIQSKPPEEASDA